MDDAYKAHRLHSRATALRDQGLKLERRAEAMPAGMMRDMLQAQATILIEGAAKIDLDALRVTPPLGAA